MPKIVAKIKTGGEQIQVNRRIAAADGGRVPAMQACLQKAGITIGAPRTARAGSAADGAAGSAASVAAAPRGRR